MRMLHIAVPRTFRLLILRYAAHRRDCTVALMSRYNDWR
jgi:hypothetical protein